MTAVNQTSTTAKFSETKTQMCNENERQSKKHADNGVSSSSSVKCDDNTTTMKYISSKHYGQFAKMKMLKENYATADSLSKPKSFLDVTYRGNAKTTPKSPETKTQIYNEDKLQRNKHTDNELTSSSSTDRIDIVIAMSMLKYASTMQVSSKRQGCFAKMQMLKKNTIAADSSLSKPKSFLDVTYYGGVKRLEKSNKQFDQEKSSFTGKFTITPPLSSPGVQRRHSLITPFDSKSILTSTTSMMGIRRNSAAA